MRIIALTQFILFLILPNAYSMDCKKNPIFCKIIENKPKLDRGYALELSNIIFKMHRKYDIPIDIFVAILRQESGYSLDAIGKRCGLNKDLEKKCVYTDFGIAQIHYKTIELWGFNAQKLTEDLEYSVEAGAKILHDFKKRYAHKEEFWYLRYNCGERGTTDRAICKEYKKMIERYM